MLPEVLAVAGAYLIGSVDFAVLVARLHDVDIHQVGSGNPGTSNVLRTLGRGPAAMVLVGDTVKGVIAAAMGLVASKGRLPLAPWAYSAGLAAVLGHCYPIFHRFKGGKGVATSAGVIFFVMPVVGVILSAVFSIAAKLSKVASISSLIVVVVAIPLALWQGLRGPSLALFLAMLALIVYRHKGNISRIIHRSERKALPT